jgi:5-methylcytosine-specific restriction endonuclease McrA
LVEDNGWSDLHEEWCGRPLAPPQPDRGWMSVGEAAVNVVERLRQAKGREWWAAYREYLASAEWQKRRLLVIERCGGICEGCGLQDAREVHHRTYEHVGDELLFELYALCGDCHKRVHAP